MENKTLEKTCDIVVVGAGHAGCEAALAGARLGLDTVMFTVSVDSIALMPCNPNVGGSSKGHLVKELDALGGEMGKNIDKTFIQSKMLNKSKGPAVHSLRAQADKQAYSTEFLINFGNFSPDPVLASLIKLSHPHPFLDAQKMTKTTEPSGRILLEMIKSSRSMMFVPSPRIWIPDHGPNPRIAGMERMMISTILNTTALLRFHPHRSIAKDRIFSNTAMTVEKLAKVINRKNNVPHRRPPAIFTKTFGNVTKISDGPASG